MMKFISKCLLVASLVVGAGFITNTPLSIISEARAADCIANNNLSETARSFIGRCRKGSINTEFPGELYEKTLGLIKQGSSAVYKKGWKLLNDSRFAK